MQTDKLEEFVKTNRDEFDFKEPSPEVWDKIASGSNFTQTIKFRHHFLRVAAVIAIVAISSVLVWQSGITSSGKLAENTDPELIELIEAEAFYSHQVDQKLKEIQKCYYTFPNLKDDIETDLTELEDMYQILKNDLEDNIANKSVIEAMIENNRYRLALCEDVLEQINC